MTADMTRQKVRFIRWDISEKKQEDLPADVAEGRSARMDRGHLTFTAIGDAAATLWYGTPDRIDYRQTLEDGSDGEIFVSRPFPRVDGEIRCYNRNILMKLLQNLTSDYVMFKIADSGIMVMRGEVGEVRAAALIAPRIEEDMP